MRQITDYTGNWKCTHWYPSNSHLGDDFDEHEVAGRWRGDTLVLESLPDDTNSYILIRLKIADNIATGSWHESTSKDSFYKGAEYSGYGQLIIDLKTFAMEGKWAGAGLDRKLNAMRIYTGNWEVVPIEKP
jgi:hypothetical protein